MPSWAAVRRRILSIETRVGVSFWLFGVCNNFSYVIMLSAANDILKEQKNGTAEVNSTLPTPAPGHRDLDCNPIGTGAILLADILPTLVLKSLAPGFVQRINFTLKILMVAVMALASFLVVGVSQAVWFSLLGVVCASLSSGLGEITFLSLSASYEKSSLSGWSSGTGAAGVLGAASYTGLTALLSPRVTLFLLCAVPMLLLADFFLLLPAPWLERPAALPEDPSRPLVPATDETQGDVNLSASDESGCEESSQVRQVEPGWRTKFRLILPMLEFMVPLSLVYFLEYLINQAFHELLFFPHAFITHAEQYRWYQTIYQIGVFFSRSSICLFSFRHIWLLCILQAANMVLLLTQIIYFYIPSIFVVFAVILFEGLLGGLAYVNTFYFILKMDQPQFAEFRMGAASVGDSFGITVAGVVSVPLHNLLCAKV